MPFKKGDFITTFIDRHDQNIRSGDIFIVLDDLPDKADITVALLFRLDEKQDYYLLKPEETKASVKNIYVFKDFEIISKSFIDKLTKEGRSRTASIKLNDKYYKFAGIKFSGFVPYVILESDDESIHILPQSYYEQIERHSGIIRKIASTGNIKKEAAVYYPIDDDLEMKISKLSHELTNEGWFTWSQCKDVKELCFKSGYCDVTNPLHIAGIETIVKEYLGIQSLKKVASIS